MAAAAGTARRRDADLARGFDVLLERLEDRLDLRGVAEEDGTWESRRWGAAARRGGGGGGAGGLARRERGLLAVL